MVPSVLGLHRLDRRAIQLADASAAYALAARATYTGGDIMSAWKPIDTAPKDRPVLVNDTTGRSITPWAAAYWLDAGGWSGWTYADDLLADAAPLGPMPSHWYDVPEAP